MDRNIPYDYIYKELNALPDYIKSLEASFHKKNDDDMYDKQLIRLEEYKDYYGCNYEEILELTDSYNNIKDLDFELSRGDLTSTDLNIDYTLETEQTEPIEIEITEEEIIQKIHAKALK